MLPSKLAPLPAHCSCPCLKAACAPSLLPLRTSPNTSVLPFPSYSYKQQLGTARLQGVPPRLSFSQRLPCCGLLLRTVPLYSLPSSFVQGLLLSTGSEMAPIQFFSVHVLQIRPLHHSRSWSWGTLTPKFSKGPFFPSGPPQTHTMKVITPVLPFFFPMSCYPAPGATDLCQGFQTCLHLRFWARMGLSAL